MRIRSPYDEHKNQISFLMLELMNDSRSLLVMLYAIRLLQLVVAVRLAMRGLIPASLWVKMSYMFLSRIVHHPCLVK